MRFVRRGLLKPRGCTSLGRLQGNNAASALITRSLVSHAEFQNQLLPWRCVLTLAVYFLRSFVSLIAPKILWQRLYSTANLLWQAVLLMASSMFKFNQLFLNCSIEENEKETRWLGQRKKEDKRYFLPCSSRVFGLNLHGKNIFICFPEARAIQMI